MKRKLAEHDNLKITIEQTGDKFHVKESSTFRTKEIDFTLGVQFDYALADGTEVTVSVILGEHSNTQIYDIYCVHCTHTGFQLLRDIITDISY